MVFEHKIGKINFEVRFDYDDIIKKMKDEEMAFEEKEFVSFGNDYEDETLSREEYIENIQIMRKNLEELIKEENLIKLIEKAQKKKNGTFYKGRIVDSYGCQNCIYICEWHNTWVYNELRVKVISDNVLRIAYESKTDTPG